MILYDFVLENFEGVSEQEIHETRGLIPYLLEIYPNEAKKALQRSKKDNYCMVKK